MGSPSPQRKKKETVGVCVLVMVCTMHQVGSVCVRVCCERKSWRLYVCISFFPSLSECLFLDRFEGQGLATSGEKLCSHLKVGKKSPCSVFTMKRKVNTHHPLKALTLALLSSLSLHRPVTDSG